MFIDRLEFVWIGEETLILLKPSLEKLDCLSFLTTSWDQIESRVIFFNVSNGPLWTVL